ncbi:MAG: AAA family ATPase [Proteobacteria bacterium]|nr:AAA family ATPase [Pseudomonadota bacterium]
MATLSDNAVRWAEARGISRSTLERAGVASGTTGMPGVGECEVIAFPYWRNGKAVNVKYRALSGKAFKQCEGGELRFWNLDEVLKAESERVYLVEGEMDALALLEAGVPLQEVVSVPNGAPQQAAADPEVQDRYRYVDAALEEGFGRAKKFVLATDSDPPGQALRQDLVRLLGPARCFFVEWPQGVKDANEFLVKFGAADLRMFLEEDQREWPVTGLYGLFDIPEPAPMEIWKPGFPEWEHKLAFAPTTVSVVTGHPGHGKTILMMQIWYQICRDYGVKAVIASFETRAKPHHRRNIRQFMYGRLDRDLSDEERAHADRWNHEHFRWIVHPNRKPSLRFVLDMAEVAIVREGARIVQIDPWNKLEGDRPGDMRETDWIGQCLDELMDFARDFNVHVQVICHPSKVDSRSRGQRPVLEDIAGSKHWDNKCDLGLSIYRPKVFEGGERKTEASLFVLKSRFDECGYPCKLALDYDLSEGRFKAADYKMAYE